MIIRLASIGLGYGLLTLGVIGIVVPILHGAIFLVLGLLVLSRHALWAQRLLDWLKGRHPRLQAMIERGEMLLARWQAWATDRAGRLFGAGRRP
jgi:uncharacterized protein